MLVCLQTLGVQERHRRPRLKAPQRLHAAALLQVQQLDQDDRVNLQEAVGAWPNSTGGSSATTGSVTASSTAM